MRKELGFNHEVEGREVQTPRHFWDGMERCRCPLRRKFSWYTMDSIVDLRSLVCVSLSPPDCIISFVQQSVSLEANSGAASQ
jgi:hypothetical protein